MATITDPAKIQFSDEKIRVAADKLAQAYNFATTVLNEWNALGGASFIANNSDDMGDGAWGTDGTDGDGRPKITGAMVNNIINRISEKITDYEDSGNAKLNTILQVAVNTIPGGGQSS